MEEYEVRKIRCGRIPGCEPSDAFEFGQTDFKAVDKSLMDNAGRQIFFEQSASTQKMLLALVTIVPAVGFILTIIPMFFNKYTGKVKAQAQAELEAKREKLMEGEEA